MNQINILPDEFVRPFSGPGEDVHIRICYTLPQGKMPVAPHIWLPRLLEANIAEAKRLQKNIRYITDKQITEWGIVK